MRVRCVSSHHLTSWVTTEVRQDARYYIFGRIHGAIFVCFTSCIAWTKCNDLVFICLCVFLHYLHQWNFQGNFWCHWKGQLDERSAVQTGFAWTWFVRMFFYCKYSFFLNSAIRNYIGICSLNLFGVRLEARCLTIGFFTTVGKQL